MVAVAVSSLSTSARVFKKITPKPALALELNRLLASASLLHIACTEMNEAKIDRSLSDILIAIDRSEKQTGLMDVEKPHLDKILDAAKTRVRLAKGSDGERRKVHLQETFNHLVQIAQAFQIDRYNIFFCPKDKSVWLQKSNRPRNPINPVELATCGKLVQ